MKIDAIRLTQKMDDELNRHIVNSMTSLKQCADEKRGDLDWTKYDIYRSQVATMQDACNMAWGAVFMLIHMDSLTPLENYGEAHAAMRDLTEKYHQLRLAVIDRKTDLFSLINNALTTEEQ